MSDKAAASKVAQFIPIAVILAVIALIEFNLFVSWSGVIQAQISASNVNGLHMTIFILTLLTLIFSIVPAILLIFNGLGSGSPGLVKLAYILTLVAMLIFIVQIILELLYVFGAI